MEIVKSVEAIADELKKKKIKRDKDVDELYLADKNLQTVADLGRFLNLKQLWLNGNKLRRISCLHHNLRLSELYLHDNGLVDIQGALHHLTSLEVLFLHNNQLQKLSIVVKELSNMHRLTKLNLFHNPLSQEPEYRIFVIHHLPSVKLLDRQEVLKYEREQGQAIYDQVNEQVKDTIAFGRQSEGPPSLCYPAGLDLQPTESVDFEVGNNFYRSNPPYTSESQAITVRALHRSVMEYTTLDWSKVPRAEKRRTAQESFETPQMVTTRFR